MGHINVLRCPPHVYPDSPLASTPNRPYSPQRAHPARRRCAAPTPRLTAGRICFAFVGTGSGILVGVGKNGERWALGVFIVATDFPQPPL